MIIRLLLIISVIGLVTIVGIFAFYKKKEKGLQKETQIDFGNSNSSWKSVFEQTYQRSYTRSLRVPGLKGIVLRLRGRIETLSVYDEYALRREVMRILFIVGTILAAIVLLALFFRPGWQIIFWIALGLMFLSGILIDFFIYRVEARLLVQLKEFNNRVRFSYQQTKMVDESIEDAQQWCGPEMKVQAEHIYTILTSVNPQAEMAKYEEVAPSRFLKVIAGLALLVKDQGDVIDKHEGSAFLQGLSAVNQELNLDIIYRSKLSYILRGLPIVALGPVFFALPLQEWGNKQFPIMQRFYESRLGFFSEVAVYGTALLAYFLIRKIGEISEAKYQAKVREFQWEKWFIEKVPGVKRLVQTFTPDKDTNAYVKLEKLLKDANSSQKIEWITVQRITLALFVGLLLTGGMIYSHSRDRVSVLYSTTPEGLFVGTLSEEELAANEELTLFDREVIKNIQQIEGITPDMLQAYIAKQMGIQEVDDPRVKVAMERIVGKWLKVENAFLKWWEVLLSIVIAFAASYIPIAVLRYQANFRKKDMENEVHQFLVILTILRRFDRMSVFVLLTWLDRFGSVFKEPIQEAIQMYDASPEEALDNLSERVSFEPFQQIVERLKLAVLRITIKESFDDIEMEREFYMEQRKEANHRSITQKNGYAGALGMAPMLTLVLLYLVVPFIYMAMTETQDVFTSF